ncbi:MAG: hypothetical protein ACUZ8H_07095 [Candidatus Anammoxibacter sp.]
MIIKNFIKSRQFLLIPAFTFILFTSLINCYASIHAQVDVHGSHHCNIKISNKVHSRFFGFGAQVYPGDKRAEQVIRDLKLSYIRVEIGPAWSLLKERPLIGAEQNEVNRYVERNFNIDYPDRLLHAKQIWDLADQYNLKIILNFFDIPGEWAEWREDLGRRILKDRNVIDFAKLWLGIIHYIKQRELIPDYLELANEPDGDWNGGFLPEQYDKLIRLVRNGLDNQHLNSIGIIGPGLSNLEKDGRTEQQINGLSSEGVDSIYAWSTHTWDEFHQTGDQTHRLMRSHWEKFVNTIRQRDHLLRKPIFVTEYSSGSTNFLGQSYSLSKNEQVPLAVDTHSYARRAFQNTLINLNHGANVMIFWSATGQDWDDKYNGLISKPSEGSKKRPMHGSLMTLMPYISPMSEVLDVLHDNELDMVITAVKSDKQLLVAISNPMPHEQFVDLDLSDFQIKEVVKSIRHQLDIIDTAEMNISLHEKIMQVKMPSDSTLTVIIQLNKAGKV